MSQSQNPMADHSRIEEVPDEAWAAMFPNDRPITENIYSPDYVGAKQPAEGYYTDLMNELDAESLTDESEALMNDAGMRYLTGEALEALNVSDFNSAALREYPELRKLQNLAIKSNGFENFNGAKEAAIIPLPSEAILALGLNPELTSTETSPIQSFRDIAESEEMNEYEDFVPLTPEEREASRDMLDQDIAMAADYDRGPLDPESGEVYLDPSVLSNIKMSNINSAALNEYPEIQELQSGLLSLEAAAGNAEAVERAEYDILSIPFRPDALMAIGLDGGVEENPYESFQGIADVDDGVQ